MTEPNRIAYVRAYLQLPGFGLSGNDIRIFSLMGDDLSSIITATIIPLQWTNEDFLQRILIAIKISFSNPDSIERSKDKSPVSTSVLLRNLMSAATLPQERMKIEDTMNVIKIRE